MVIRILIAILIGSLVFEYSSILPISASIVESYHPYPNKNEWKIHMPGATEMRIHSTKLDIAYNDYLILLLDKDKRCLHGGRYD